ncbi:MAG: hypothetical protein F6K47_12440 [Symploca sp. SIO2E6]|nr:hypothetical protein [Symploca sp. SIO2E6]
MQQLSVIGSITLMIALNTIPVLSQEENKEANFDSLILSPGFSPNLTLEGGQVGGYTSGSFPLSSKTNSDRHGNPCIGFGDTTPDHKLVLEQDFSNLTVQVNSRGKGTTLVIQGPDKQTFRCGDGIESTNDATVKDQIWEAGTYWIWVGTVNSGTMLNYTLTVRE